MDMNNPIIVIPAALSLSSDHDNKSSITNDQRSISTDDSSNEDNVSCDTNNVSCDTKASTVKLSNITTKNSETKQLSPTSVLDHLIYLEGSLETNFGSATTVNKTMNTDDAVNTLRKYLNGLSDSNYQYMCNVLVEMMLLDISERQEHIDEALDVIEIVTSPNLNVNDIKSAFLTLALLPCDELETCLVALSKQETTESVHNYESCKDDNHNNASESTSLLECKSSSNTTTISAPEDETQEETSSTAVVVTESSSITAMKKIKACGNCNNNDDNDDNIKILKVVDIMYGYEEEKHNVVQEEENISCEVSTSNDPLLLLEEYSSTSGSISIIEELSTDSVQIETTIKVPLTITQKSRVGCSSSSVISLLSQPSTAAAKATPSIGLILSSSILETNDRQIIQQEQEQQQQRNQSLFSDGIEQEQEEQIIRSNHTTTDNCTETTKPAEEIYIVVNNNKYDNTRKESTTSIHDTTNSCPPYNMDTSCCCIIT